MSATSNLIEANARHAVEQGEQRFSSVAMMLIRDALALINHLPEDFDIRLALVGNICTQCALATGGETLRRENDALYSILPRNEMFEYPHGLFCVDHGMIGWRESSDKPEEHLCTKWNSDGFCVECGLLPCDGNPHIGKLKSYGKLSAFLATDN